MTPYDSLALKCAKVEQQLLKNRGINIPVVLQEQDSAAEATRIVISATRGNPEMQDSGTGIFGVAVMVDLHVQGGDGSTALVDHYLREIDLANNTVPEGAANLVRSKGLSVWIGKDDDVTTEQDDGDDIRKVRRTYSIAAKET